MELLISWIWGEGQGEGLICLLGFLTKSIFAKDDQLSELEWSRWYVRGTGTILHRLVPQQAGIIESQAGHFYLPPTEYESHLMV